MDPVTNPFAPGAGTRSPELAGRDTLREVVRIALERLRRGRASKSVLMVGLRGVGKTVLLDAMLDDAESRGHSNSSRRSPATAIVAGDPSARASTGLASAFALRALFRQLRKWRIGYYRILGRGQS